MYLPRCLPRSLYLVTPFVCVVIALLKRRAAEPDWTSRRRSAAGVKMGIGRTGSAERRGGARWRGGRWTRGRRFATQ
jgi:hypothetical protein